MTSNWIKNCSKLLGASTNHPETHSTGCALAFETSRLVKMNNVTRSTYVKDTQGIQDEPAIPGPQAVAQCDGCDDLGTLVCIKPQSAPALVSFFLAGR